MQGQPPALEVLRDSSPPLGELHRVVVEQGKIVDVPQVTLGAEHLLRIREGNALAKILEKFIAKELQPWTLTFPNKFYEEICRLRGWDDILSVRRPSVVGRITNDVVYERLAPGVLVELREKNPVLPEGYRAQRHHQWLTPDLGHPKLRQHLADVMLLMKISPSWNVFKRHLDMACPKPGEKPPEHEKPSTLEKFFTM